MSAEITRRRWWPATLIGACLLMPAVGIPQARQISSDTRDPKEVQDGSFARAYNEWTRDAKYGSPLVDHLPIVKRIPTPKDVSGYHVGAPKRPLSRLRRERGR